MYLIAHVRPEDCGAGGGVPSLAGDPGGSERLYFACALPEFAGIGVHRTADGERWSRTGDGAQSYRGVDPQPVARGA